MVEEQAVTRSNFTEKNTNEIDQQVCTDLKCKEIPTRQRIEKSVTLTELLEPFTDLTFPKENILPEEKNSWIHGKKFEYERLSISACEHARVL